MAKDDPPPPADVTPPTVTQTWANGPAMDGNIDTPTGPRFGKAVPTRKGAAPPVVRNYTVAPGSIEDAENEILSSTGDLTASYTALKDYINDVKSWIFSVPSPADLHQWVTVGGFMGDPNPKTTAEMSAISDNMLLAVADTLETTGQFIAALNHAGQLYTKADKDSDLPTLPVVFDRSRPQVRTDPPTDQ